MIKMLDILNEYLYGTWADSDLKSLKWKLDKEYIRNEYDPNDFNESGFNVIRDPRFVEDAQRLFTAYYTIANERKYRLLLTPFVGKYMNYVYKVKVWDIESGEVLYDREYPNVDIARKAIRPYVGMFLKMIKIPPKQPFNPYDGKKRK